MTRQFILFMLVGGLAAAVNVAGRWLANQVMPFEAAIVVGFLAGLVTAFVLNRAFVFRASGAAGRQFRRFAIVNLLALAQVWLISVGLAEWLFPHIGFVWHAELVAHAIGVASPVLTGYFAHRYYSFAEPGIDKATAAKTDLQPNAATDASYRVGDSEGAF